MAESRLPLKEVVVIKEGIKGIMDGFEECPVEFKTTNSNISDLRKERMEYLEQLAIYSSITDSASGKLVIFNRKTGTSNAYLIKFRDLAGIWKEVLDRKSALLHALEYNDPTALPICRFQGKGFCSYRDICNCNKGGKELGSMDAFVESIEPIEWYDKKKPIITVSSYGILFPLKWFYDQRAIIDAKNKIGDMQNIVHNDINTANSPEYSIKNDISYSDIGGFRQINNHNINLSIHTIFDNPVEVKMVDDINNIYNIMNKSLYKILLLIIKAAYSGKNSGYLIAAKGNDNSISNYAVIELNFKNMNVFKENIECYVNDLVKGVMDNNPDNFSLCPTWLCKECVYKKMCKAHINKR